MNATQFWHFGFSKKSSSTPSPTNPCGECFGGQKFTEKPDFSTLPENYTVFKELSGLWCSLYNYANAIVVGQWHFTNFFRCSGALGVSSFSSEVYIRMSDPCRTLSSSYSNEDNLKILDISKVNIDSSFNLRLPNLSNLEQLIINAQQKAYMDANPERILRTTTEGYLYGYWYLHPNITNEKIIVI